MKKDQNTTQAIADFVVKTNFEDIPDNIVNEAKRIILDSFGCALLGHSVDKGRIAVELARYLGGRPEATILGTGEKVAPTNAAFANGELTNSMDYDPITPPGHSSSFVIPAVLALAEMERASGKSFLTAAILAHEVAIRIGSALPSGRSGKTLSKRPHGLGMTIFGAAAGAGKILAFDKTTMLNALGIAGYLTPIPSATKWSYSSYTSMFKYGSAGWIAQCGVTGVLLAQRGYLGDDAVLDGPHGFWRMYCANKCDWERITRGLGKEWMLMIVAYKHYPLCGLATPSVEAFSQIVETHDLKPEEIEKVTVKGEKKGLEPCFHADPFRSHMDAQFNHEYGVAMVAHRVKVTDWHDQSTLNDPKIRAFMKKVKFEPFPKYEESRYQEMVVEKKPYIIKRPAFAEVVARGQTFTAEVEYPRWGPQMVEKLKLPDSELIGKFRANASKILPGSKVEKAIQLIFGLEELDNIAELTKTLCP